MRYRFAAFVLLGLAAVAVVSLLGSAALPLRSAGGSRLLAIDPLPEYSGEMCSWMPVSSTGQEAQFAGLHQAVGSDDVRITLERPPLRVIKDPHPTFSAAAVDPINNEIVLQDENLFQIMTYDRMTNTPPSASMSEPKRVIGGHLTHMEFNCALYIDPRNGDIYSVNNDTLDTLVIFSREVRGNMPPTRQLHTPHRTYGIAVDETAEEMFLTVQDPPHVVVYRKYAEGDEEPVRILRGNNTQLADAHGIALDIKKQWMFVVNYGNGAKYREPAQEGGQVGGRVRGSGYFTAPSITVYRLKAEGDVTPIRTIAGPRTQMNWPAHMHIDEEAGLLYVANDGDDSILVFRTTDNGNVAPTRVIKGPRTQIKNPTGVFVDSKNKEIVVANMGNHRATVYPLDANGDVIPKRVIRAAPADQPALQIGNPGAVGFDTKRDQILVPN
jgi:6-phosphogluconolactonase (cycloisomerase 2 family)